MGKHEPIGGPVSGRERVSRRRQALRDQGLRPRQFWLPDLRDPLRRAEAARQAALIAASPAEAADQAFIDAVADWDLPEA